MEQKHLFSALAVFSRNALYKSTFYLLTYLLFCDSFVEKCISACYAFDNIH